MKTAASRSGQMLNYTNLARDIGVSQPTAKKYLSVLEASNIVRLLYPYKTNRSNLSVLTPKLYFLDTGLMAFLTDWKTPEVLSSGAMAGHFFETWCVGEIVKSYVNAGEKPPLYYFRDREKNPSEIDVVIEAALPLSIRVASDRKRPDHPRPILVTPSSLVHHQRTDALRDVHPLQQRDRHVAPDTYLPMFSTVKPICRRAAVSRQLRVSKTRAGLRMDA